MPGDIDPLKFLTEELDPNNPQQSIQAITRLRVIGLALGQARARERRERGRSGPEANAAWRPPLSSKAGPLTRRAARFRHRAGC